MSANTPARENAQPVVSQSTNHKFEIASDAQIARAEFTMLAAEPALAYQIIGRHMLWRTFAKIMPTDIVVFVVLAFNGEAHTSGLITSEPAKVMQLHAGMGRGGFYPAIERLEAAGLIRRFRDGKRSHSTYEILMPPDAADIHPWMNACALGMNLSLMSIVHKHLARAGDECDIHPRMNVDLSGRKARAGDECHSLPARANLAGAPPARAGDECHSLPARAFEKNVPKARAGDECGAAPSSSYSSPTSSKEEEGSRMQVAGELATMPLSEAMRRWVIEMGTDARTLFAAKLDCEKNQKRKRSRWFPVPLFKSLLLNPERIDAEHWHEADRLLNPSSPPVIAPASPEREAERRIEEQIDRAFDVMTLDQIDAIRREGAELALTPGAKKSALETTEPNKHTMLRMIVRSKLQQQRGVTAQ